MLQALVAQVGQPAGLVGQALVELGPEGVALAVDGADPRLDGAREQGAQLGEGVRVRLRLKSNAFSFIPT